MRHYSCVLCVVGALGVCNQGYGAIVVEERAGYALHTDYELSGDSEITILNPIDVEKGPYWFECYDDSTEYPYAPALIQRISAAPGIGAVEVKVTGYDERTYGASDVWLIQISQTSGGGRVVELTISGNYGAVDQGDTLIADSAGTISIGSGATGDIVKPVHILGDLDSLTVRGAILPEVTVDGDVGTLLIGTLSGEFRITSGNLTEAAWVTDLHGCFDVAAGHVAPPAGNKFKVTTLAGTLTIAGDLAGGDGLLVDDLRPQGLIEIGGSVLSTVRFAPYMSGTLHVVGGADHSGGRRIGAPL